MPKACKNPIDQDDVITAVAALCTRIEDVERRLALLEGQFESHMNHYLADVSKNKKSP
jgi:hypothetical protein